MSYSLKLIPYLITIHSRCPYPKPLSEIFFNRNTIFEIVCGSRGDLFYTLLQSTFSIHVHTRILLMVLTLICAEIFHNFYPINVYFQINSVRLSNKDKVAKYF